ncbi:MAG: glycosyltransferase family 2 protein [Candidatus Omnitrophota bacterium]
MKVSIITVCRNAKRTIGRAFDSISSQTYPYVEKIIIDGLSFDGTQEVVKRYLKPCDKFISEADSGIYDAMNKGVALATGDIIYFLNADDSLYDKDVLTDIVKEFSSYNDRAIIYGKVLYETSNKRHNSYPPIFQFHALKDFMHHTLCHQAVFAKRDVFLSIGGFDLKYRLAADKDWFIRAYKHVSKSFVYVDRVIANYNYFGQSFQYKKQCIQEAEMIIWRHFSLSDFLLYWIRYSFLRAMKRRILNRGLYS